MSETGVANLKGHSIAKSWISIEFSFWPLKLRYMVDPVHSVKIFLKKSLLFFSKFALHRTLAF